MLEYAPILAAPFCFLRHGETESNRLGLIAGSTDVPLNETGIAQARASACRLAASGIDAIWSSPLTRARTTAAHVAEALRLPVHVVPQIAERNWGELEGTPRALRVRGVTPPGGESAEEFHERTLAGIRAIAASRLPLVVAHSGTFRVLCAWLGIAMPAPRVGNCTPMQFQPLQGGWCVAPFPP
jgi:probable phosphoglycerate mutase